MNHSVRRLFISYKLSIHLMVAGGIGLLLGAFSVWFSPVWALIALVGVVLIFISLKRPEIALLGILVATSSIIFEDRLPIIPVPGGFGSLHISDVILLSLFGLIILRHIVEPDFRIIRTPIDMPLLSFYSIILLSIFIAVFRSSLEFNIARRAIRIVTYYLTFFIVTNLVREDRQLRMLLRGFILIATIVAVAMIIQFLVGASLSLLPERVETLVTQGTIYGGVTRVLPPGQSIILVAFIVITVTLVLENLRPINFSRFFQWGTLGLAIILTFMRSFWVVVSLALLILAFLVKGQDRRRLVGWGLVVLLLVSIILLVGFNKPDSQIAQLISATGDRLATLGNQKTLSESSLTWRYIETEYALRQIVSHPLLGLGVGAIYRPYDSRIDTTEMLWNWKEWSMQRYIHNGHLEIIMGSGLLGYLCLVWLSLSFMMRGFRHWRLIPNSEMKGYVLGFTLTYLGVLISAFLHPWFSRWYWTAIIGIMMGVNEIIIRKTLSGEVEINNYFSKKTISLRNGVFNKN